MALSAGDSLGPYHIISPLGAGGMGVVLRAWDTKLDRTVAIKVLSHDLAEDEEALGRFEREAKAIASLSHPNILSIHDFGKIGGVAFAVMELLEGETLRGRLSRGALPVRKAIDLALQASHALTAAHEKGIVHRDIKPENLFLCANGRLKVLDFGLARLVPQVAVGGEESPTLSHHTVPGTLMGTVAYMSPEQLKARPVDARADIFSLGAVLHEMLSGRRPFAGDSAVEVMSAILREDAPSLGRPVPPGLARVVQHCLEKDPEERFRSAHDLAFALEAAGSDSGISSIVCAPSRLRLRTIERLGLLAAGAGLALLGTFLRERPAAPPAPASFHSVTYSGRDTAPSASPDGRLVAFVSDRDGRPRIWLKQVEGDGESVLTAGPDDSPRFSPDGAQVLFARREGPHSSLYRMPTLGGEARKVLDDAVEGDFLPGGKEIAFLRLRSENGRTVSVLGVSSLGGTDVREVARVEGRRLTGPRVSPDGAWIAATPALGTPLTSARTEITLAPVGGGPVRVVAAPKPRRQVSTVAWTGDGGLVYAQAESVVTAAGSAAQIILQDPSTSAIRNRVWCPSSSQTLDVIGPGKVVFDARSPQQNLREVALSGNAAAAPRWLCGRGESTDRQPTYSPDGEWVAFSSNRGGAMNLWMVATRTGNLRRVTDVDASEWDPAFSPQGKLFWSSDRRESRDRGPAVLDVSDPFEVWMAEADGSGARRVTSDGRNAENPTLTPDGAWIVYSSRNPEKAGIWKVRPDGREATRLVADQLSPAPSGSGRATLPEVSPDGEHVSYRFFSGQYPAFIRVVRLADGASVPFEIPVTEARKTATQLGRHRWMPGGKALAFVGQDDSGTNGVFVQDFVPGRDTASTRRPLAGFDAETATESFGVSPDGTHVVIAGWVQLFSVMEGEGLGFIRPGRSGR